MMGFFLFATMSRSTLGSTQSPIQWVLVAVTLLPPFSAKVKDVWRYTLTPLIHLHGVMLN